MPKIAVLSQETIDKIAAGEVVERPSSVVKELVENAIDAGASAITVEIKEGGTSFIRITDNGCGIEKSQIQLAFLRHSTSKIHSADDLMTVKSLGFRGEALSSIAAVSRVELITKTYDQLTGCRYVIEGSREMELEEIGAPDGTTFLVKDLFYNTPARRKFLKSPQTEGNYITDIVEKLALSHPDVSFKLINNNQTKLHTSGNGRIKDLIYHIYGRDISSNIIEVDYQGNFFNLKGYIGKPVVTRGNRNYESYFINGRYVKSQLISRAIEEAYKNFMMQHQYPFTVLYFEFKGDLDVNVHPTKMELRFDNTNEVYVELCDAIYGLLAHREMIPEVPVEEKKDTEFRKFTESIPEPFEKRRINDIRKAIAKDTPYEPKYEYRKEKEHIGHTDHEPVNIPVQSQSTEIKKYDTATAATETESSKAGEEVTSYKQYAMEDVFLSQQAKAKHRIIGQLFDTYWLIEYEDKLFIIDQHAAHEKVLYERTMARLSEKEYTSQMISPPIIMTLDAREEEALENYSQQIKKMGYQVEPFGGKEYMISAVPDNLFNIDMKELFIEMLDDFSNLTGRQNPQLILEKVASMSCKAAVKGNNKLSYQEMDALIEELLTLDNPYNCPHGRPTIIAMSKYEIEKKFKRIV